MPMPAGETTKPPERSLIAMAKALLKWVLASTAVFYALGYVVSLAHFRMLGVTPRVDLTHEEVLWYGILFVPMTALWWVETLLRGLFIPVSVLGMLAWSALLLLFFAPRWWWRQRTGNRWPARGFDWCARQCQVIGRTRLVRALSWPARALARPLRYVPLLGITVAGLALLRTSFVVLSGTNLLPRGGADPFPSWFRDVLTSLSCPDCEDLVALLDVGFGRTLYGLFSLLAVGLLLSWTFCFRRRFPDWRPPPGAPRIGGTAQLAFIVSGLLLAVQLVIVVVLYGYLVVTNEYPAVTPTVPTLHESHGKVRPGEKLVVIGRHGDRVVVYTTEGSELLWVDKSALLPAVQDKPCDVIKVLNARPRASRSSHGRAFGP